MNEKYQNIEVDELISLYIDGLASERQQTELKRLIMNDASVGERLEAQQFQQQLLNALPVESAPVSLADDVRAALERKLILADTSDQSQTVLATSHLFLRRMAAVAAMFLLPVGLLALVVFQIVKPAPEGPGGSYVSSGKIINKDPGTAVTPPERTEAVRDLPFKGTLILRTGDVMAVNDAIRKAIEQQDLLANAFPGRTADVSRFSITASPRQAANLVDALAGIRSQCEGIALQVQDGLTGETIEIANVDNEQLKSLMYEDNPTMFDRLAARYADANRRADPLFERTEPDGYPRPSIPTLAGKYDSDDRTVQLTIQVERTDGE